MSEPGFDITAQIVESSNTYLIPGSNSITHTITNVSAGGVINLVADGGVLVNGVPVAGGGGGPVPNWSTVPASGNIDCADHELDSVSSIRLPGIVLTTAGYNLTVGRDATTPGNVYDDKYNQPPNWAGVTAGSDVSMNYHAITGASALTLALGNNSAVTSTINIGSNGALAYSTGGILYDTVKNKPPGSVQSRGVYYSFPVQSGNTVAAVNISASMYAFEFIATPAWVQGMPLYPVQNTTRCILTGCVNIYGSIPNGHVYTGAVISVMQGPPSGLSYTPIVAFADNTFGAVGPFPTGAMVLGRYSFSIDLVSTLLPWEPLCFQVQVFTTVANPTTATMTTSFFLGAVNLAIDLPVVMGAVNPAIDPATVTSLQQQITDLQSHFS